ncbi:DUF883 family protein [Caulobacter sp.]|uniref:DUF883 family protein n=1 Tax=Caulobacter sp. TaxID=78 RepID=UPI003BB08356
MTPQDLTLTDFPTSAPPVNGAAEAKLRSAASSAQDAYGDLKSAATETLGDTREKVQDALGRTREQLERRYDELEAYVQLRPAVAVGIAATVGVLVGLLLRGPSKTIYLRGA